MTGSDGTGSTLAGDSSGDPFWTLSSELLAVLSPTGVFVRVNPAWRAELGHDPDALPGTDLVELLHPHDLAALLIPGSEERPDGFRLDGLVCRVVGADGSYHFVTWRAVQASSGWHIAGRVLHAATLVPEEEKPLLWATVAASVQELMAVVDHDGTILSANDAWCHAAYRGGSSTDFVGSNYLAVCDAADDEHARAAAVGLRAVLGGQEQQFTLNYPFGDRWYRLRVTAVDDYTRAGAVVVHADITDDRAREMLTQQRARLIDEIEVAVTRVSAAGEIADWNRGAEHVFGWTRDEVIGRAAVDVLAADPDAGVWTEGEPQRPNEHQVVMRRKDGSPVPVRHRVSPLGTGDGLPAGELSVILDATAEAAALHEILDTRNFLEAVTDSMAEGLVVLDGDGRPILLNPAAEELLGWSADELRDVRMHDVVHGYRADGSPYPLDDCPIVAAWRDHVSVRVSEDCFVRRDGSPLPVAYTAAPLGVGGGCVVVFNDATQVRAEERRLRHELQDLTDSVRVREALEQDSLVLYAQPIVRVDTGEVVQRELLLRVVEPDGTVSAPAPFLAAAERLGLSGKVDRWVARRAIELAAGGRPVELNLSAASLTDAGLLRAIGAWIEEYGADPADLTFEITETALIADEAAGRAFVTRLRELGCRIALDDFGTGYGGFTYLKKLDVDFLKIDLEFVVDLVENEASRHVVQAVVNLARSFGLQTVAEGVEDRATLELLRSYGVDYAQGFLLGRPAPMPVWGDRGALTDRAVAGRADQS